MNIYFYISLIFGISLVFYLTGYQPVGFELLTAISQEGLSITDLISSLVSNLSTVFSLFLPILGIAAVTSFLGYGGAGNTLWVFMKIALLLLAINFFVLPTTFITQAGLNPILSTVILAFLNVLTLMVVISVIE